MKRRPDSPECRPAEYPPHDPPRTGRSCPIPPRPRTAVLGRFSGAHGQGLVEFALVLPLIMFMMLGAAEMGMLYAAFADQDRRTATMAEWSAEHPDSTEAEWSDLVVSIGPCGSAERSVDGDIVTVQMTCTYNPRITGNVWSGLPVSTEAVAAIRGEVAGETAAPSVAP